MLLLLPACTATPPKNTQNICSIFLEKDDWYIQAKDAYEKWGIPINVTMAIMHQESRFVADAQPPRPWLLGIIPWFRSSSAYGYAQAKDGTWDDYLKNSQSIWSADRDEFADACDFIGWYCSISNGVLILLILKLIDIASSAFSFSRRSLPMGSFETLALLYESALHCIRASA